MRLARERLRARAGWWPALLALACAHAAPAHAWGAEGHEVIGLIAQHFLNPAAQAQVNALLATDNSALTPDTGMVSETNWADRFRNSDRRGIQARFEATRLWHYIDIELDHPDLDAACFGHPPLSAGTPASLGPANDCIVDKITEFEAELRSQATPPAERLEALQFLLHFIGDIHQPLHASDDHDRGGNGKRVVATDLPPDNLHRYWDIEFVRLLGPDASTVAQGLLGQIRPGQRRQWAAGDARDWALETYAISKASAYGALPAAGADEVYTLPDAYVRAATRIVATQLSKAGVRLAMVLNDTMRN
jgi:hypothetical protein